MISKATKLLPYTPWTHQRLSLAILCMISVLVRQVRTEEVILLLLLISILKVRDDIGALALEAVSSVPTPTVSRGQVVLTFVAKNSAFTRRGSPCFFGSSSSPFFPRAGLKIGRASCRERVF